MRALRRALLPALLLALAAAPPAQIARFVDSPRLDWRSMTFDAARGEMLLLGNDNLHALRGGQWQRMPATGLPVLLEQYGVRLFAPEQQRRLLAMTVQTGSVLKLFGSDGMQWSEIPTSTAIVFVDGVHAAFDHSRNELVTFGGNTGNILSYTYDETWVFDGTAWQPRNPTNVPPRPLSTGAMAYDEARQVVVLVTGSLQTNYETWEWNGVDWQFIATTTIPPPRRSPHMAFDSARSRMVLFGGFDGTNALADCWEYDGSNWQAVAPMPGTGRRHPAMAYDPTTASVLVMGGNDGIHDLQDAWAWDGTTWAPAPTVPAAPRARFRPNFAIEPGNTSVLMYGGSNARQPLSYYDETWRWDGTSWAQVGGAAPMGGLENGIMWSQQNETHLLFGNFRYLMPNWIWATGWPHGMSTWNGSAWTAGLAPTLPPLRESSAIAVDTLRNEAVLFGGISDTGFLLADTWVFDGSTWTQRVIANPPGPRANHTMAYDPVRDRVVLYGGTNGGIHVFDTWEWNGTTWSAVTTATTPPSGTICYSPVTNDIRLVADTPTGQPHVWRYDGTDWAPVPGHIENNRQTRAVGFVGSDLMLAIDGRLMAFRSDDAQLEAVGTTCTADAPSLGANELPRLGASGFALELLYGPTNGIAALAGADSALPTPIVALGCTLHVDPTQALALLTTNANGKASFNLAIPNQATLLNVDLYFQGATLSALAPQGITLTRALRTRLGR